MIRLATQDDMPSIRDIYAAARRFMAASGNPTQWGTNKPSEAQLLEDIRLKQLFVEEHNGRLCAAFALVAGNDLSYAYIKGAWQDNTPYSTIHRLAADGSYPGFFARCVDFCRQQALHLRVDTHKDNRVMRHLVEKHGFAHCGIIYIADGSPRLAYEWSA